MRHLCFTLTDSHVIDDIICETVLKIDTRDKNVYLLARISHNKMEDFDFNVTAEISNEFLTSIIDLTINCTKKEFQSAPVKTHIKSELFDILYELYNTVKFIYTVNDKKEEKTFLINPAN